MPILIDLTGHEFYRLTVLYRTVNGRSGQVYWQCHCSCGTEKSISAQSLLSGATHSCGCLQREKAHSTCVLRNTTHGQFGSKTHRIWAGIIQRCCNIKNQAYINYGGRGIRVHDRWLVFDNFFSDMGECPPGLSIERRDNNGDYEPNNCYWATRLEQNSNTRKNRLIIIHNRSQTMSQWLRELKVPRTTFYRWLQKKPELSDAEILMKLSDRMGLSPILSRGSLM